MAVVVAQLVELLLLTPEVRGLNPVIGKLLNRTFICLLSTVYLKDENKKRGRGMAHLKKHYGLFP